MKPTVNILTYAQMAFVINIKNVDYRKINNIIMHEYDSFNESCDKYRKQSLKESLTVIKRYSYIAFSYAISLNENDYSHFRNIIINAFTNVKYDPYFDALTKHGLTEIAKEYYEYVRSFR